MVRHGLPVRGAQEGRELRIGIEGAGGEGVGRVGKGDIVEGDVVEGDVAKGDIAKGDIEGWRERRIQAGGVIGKQV